VYVETRSKGLSWRIVAITLFLSLLSVIMLQSAAEASYLPSLNQNSPTSSIHDNWFANFEHTYYVNRAILLQDTLKPTLLQANHFIRLNNENMVKPSPSTEQKGDGISWTLSDSSGRQYRLDMTLSEYRSFDSAPRPAGIKNLETDSRQIIVVKDYSLFVQPEPFSHLADQIYENSGSDYRFIYETWYVATHAATYSREDQERVNLPLETLSLGTGDCEDLTILIASVLTASAHTKGWDIKMVYFDADHPEDSGAVNHVALYVDTGKERLFVESTADSNGLAIWDKVDGWPIDI